MRHSIAQITRSIALLAVLVGLWTAPSATAQPLSKVYVGLFRDNAIAVVDGQTNQVVKTISVPAGPHGLVATTDGRKVYVSSDGATSVSVIDTRSDEVIGTIEVGAEPHGLVLSPDGRSLIVGGWGSDRVLLVDTASDQIVGEVGVARAHNIAVSPDGGRAYVGSQKSDGPAVVVVDLPSLTISGSVPVSGNPRGLSVSPDGSVLYLTQAGQDDVAVVDLATMQVSATIPIGPSPHFPLFASASTGLVDSQGQGVLHAIDVVSGSIRSSVAVGQRPHWTAVSADGRRAYVTNEGSNDLTVVNLDTMTALLTVPVGNAPRKVAIVRAPAQAELLRTEARIARFNFPAQLETAPGAEIAFQNDDQVPHTVTSEQQIFDSGDIVGGGTFIVTLQMPGTYAYYCSLHKYMRGTIAVQG